MIKIKDKKGGEKYLTPWLFLVFGIIGVGIVAGVIVFYSAQVDVRAEEANILAVRISDCLIDDGYLNEEISSNNVFEKCNLDGKMFEIAGDFYFNISVGDDSKNVLKEIKKGNNDLEFQCGIKKEEKQFAECSERIVYALNQSDKSQKFIIKILAASNQLGEKV